jgi:three-Cys-motif partner protein
MNNEEQLSLDFNNQNEQNSEDYFASKRDWSASKHRILLRYIQSFVYNLSNYNQINYVDGFSGTGSYEKGIGIEDFVNNSKFWVSKYSHNFKNNDGSPLIALKCAKLFLQEKRANLRCFFVESDKKSHHELTLNCHHEDQENSYIIYEPKEFAELFEIIMNDLGKHPTLFFIDPFGVKGITFKQICTIGKYLKNYKGELFLLFHNRAVARHAGHFSKKIKADQKFIDNLVGFLGINSEEYLQQKWLELKQQAQDFENWTLEYFKYKMLTEGGFKGVTSFPIKEEYNEKRPQYHIVVGSNFPQRVFGTLLNDSVFQETELLFKNSGKTENAKIFFEQQWQKEIRKRIESVTERVKEILRNQTDWISCEDVITKIILALPEIGYLKRTHYYQDILAAFYKEGILQTKNINTSPKKKEFTLKTLIKIV